MSDHSEPTREEATADRANTARVGDSRAGDSQTGETRTGETRPIASITVASDQLLRLQEKLNRLNRTIRLAIEAELASLTGHSFGTLTANQAVVAMIQETVESHGLRVRCPECGHPGILRCSGRPGVLNGVFVFDHTIEGRRTFHGGTATVPELRIVAKPRRRSAKKAS